MRKLAVLKYDELKMFLERVGERASFPALESVSGLLGYIEGKTELEREDKEFNSYLYLRKEGRGLELEWDTGKHKVKVRNEDKGTFLIEVDENSSYNFHPMLMNTLHEIVREKEEEKELEKRVREEEATIGEIASYIFD